MSGTQSLPTAVDALEDKAREHKQAQNTEYHVSVARHNIREINSELDDLEESVRDLRYYKTVFVEAFDGSVPTMVSSAVQAAENAVEVTQDELLANIQNNAMDEGETVHEEDLTGLEVELTPEVKKQRSQIRSAKQMVENVSENIQTKLESKRDTWSTRVSAAEELQKILGSQNSDFARTLNHMHQLLTRDLMDSSENASRFVSEWENATDNWEEHQSLQSFDDFKEKHDLSDSTIEDVKTLSKSQQLTLADVSMDTLEEMKRVDELESAVELSL
ncbi:hypothetical protein DVK05_12955 [Halorubrum sp. Atlit-8R]|uniref:hypothetical protein n=1 Tax=unclassified Halorubrum TaxID=2642239 RepID=UPI000EF22FE5|nr:MULTISPECIES: hypothetical protein [unclassified Halorubrum]RLM63817.1 hypothetical protein DVK08_14700 [Halorubrum sp. Atlit-9R]RLM77195.1 hypothetical protein DVK05_12955 [Halorubrum sp. Atlit-8R]